MAHDIKHMKKSVYTRFSKKRKIILKPYGSHGGAAFTFFSPYTVITYCAVSLLMPKLLLVLIAPTHKGMDRLS